MIKYLIYLAKNGHLPSLFGLRKTSDDLGKVSGGLGKVLDDSGSIMSMFHNFNIVGLQVFWGILL